MSGGKDDIVAEKLQFIDSHCHLQVFPGLTLITHVCNLIDPEYCCDGLVNLCVCIPRGIHLNANFLFQCQAASPAGPSDSRHCRAVDKRSQTSRSSVAGRERNVRGKYSRQICPMPHRFVYIRHTYLSVFLSIRPSIIPRDEKKADLQSTLVLTPV